MKTKCNLSALLACVVGVALLAEPRMCAGQETGLIGHWTFDDPANLGRDSVSTHHGTVVGGAYAFASARIGQGTLSVNGADGHIEVPDAPELRFTLSQSYTLSVWIQTASISGGWRGLVDKSRDVSPFYGLWLDGSGQPVGGGNNINGPAVTEGWHHLALVQDGAAGTRDLYADGAVVASGTAIAADGTGPLWIGAAAGVTEFFSGLIDDARLYNRALTADEIGQLFNAPMPSSTLPLALLTQPDDLIVSPGGKARFVARANALNLTFQWYKGSTPVGSATAAAFNNGGAEAVFSTDALTQADDGTTYSVVFSGGSGSLTSRVARISVLAPEFSPGFLKRELYVDIAGTLVTDLTGDPKFPASPDETSVVGLFEAPSNIRDNYGQRLSGFVTPSDTGTYLFYLAADDNAELYLSTDDTAANKRLIASEPEWNPARYWSGTDRRNPDAPENVSAPVRLEGGKKYYVEVLHKEGTGGDSLGVTAIKEGDPAPENGSAPLGGSFIGTFATPTGQTISITNQPADIVTVELARVTFTVGASASGNAPRAFQWQKNGTNIFNAVEAAYTTPPILAADHNSKYACVVYLPGNVTMKSREAVLKVDLDKTPPSVVRVLSPQVPGTALGTEVYVAFDETVEPGSATNLSNYALSPTKTITAASLQKDAKTVVLAADLAAGVNYQITIKNVTDLSAARNRLSDTVKSFQVSDLIAHYSFESPDNLGADDIGISQGKVVGAVAYTGESRVGDGALRASGTGGRIEVADNSLLRFGIDQSYTVAAWIKTASIAGGWRGLVNKSRNSAPFYGLWLDPSGQPIAGGNNINGQPINLEWHHLAVVQDGGGASRDLFVDGVAVANGSAIAADGTGPLYIGGAAGVTEFFNGWIDEVRIYNRALSESEVQALATVPTPAPRVSLAIARIGNSIQITWPDSATGFVLEYTDTLGSAATWKATSQTPTLGGGFYSVTIPAEGQGRWYRLKK